MTAVVTVAFLIVLAINVAPWLRGPKAWRWPYAIPGTTSRLWLPAAVLALYIALATWLARGGVGRDVGREDLAPTRGRDGGLGREDLAPTRGRDGGLGRDDPAPTRGRDGGLGRDDFAPTRWVVIVAIVASMLMTPGIQLALLYMDHVDVRSQLFYRTVAEGANGFFNVGAVVMDRYDFLRYFSERAIDWYPTHAERHPPGLPILFSLARQLFDATPRLTARLNDLYRPYQCHNVPLMNLPDGAIASATIQMALPLLLSLVVPPLYLLGREVYGRAAAVRTVLLWPLIPGIALWSAYWTPLYALFTVLALLLLHGGLSRHRLVLLAGSGLVISISTFLSFGNAAIVGFLGLYALFWLANACWRNPNVPGEDTRSTAGENTRSATGENTQSATGENTQSATGGSILSLSKDAPSKEPALSVRPSIGSKGWLLGGALFFALGAASLWAWLWFRYRLGFFAVWQTAMGRHFEMERTGWFWILYHLYDFYVAAAGIPILFFWAARTWDALREIRSRRGALDVLALSFFVGLVLLDLSGVARGEVARVWAFLLPLPLLIAVYRLPRRGVAFPALIILLSVQLFVTNVFVRYIGTDLSDPPAPPARAVLGGDWTPWQATWEEGIALNGVQMPRAVIAGRPISVGAIWSTSRRVHHPYTAFVHMFDEQGRLVAQRDVMHLDGDWPTTCWRPGELFEDTYTLVQLEPLAPGAHRVEVGLYWLPSGERVPVTGKGVQPHQAVAIGTIEVQGKE